MASRFYQYDELLEPDAFRLLILEPSPDRNAIVRGNLITSTLSHYDTDLVDHYMALSYVWGDQNNRCLITLNGKDLDITASLDLALRYIRDPSRQLQIWADGICINQQKMKEKEIQVPLMGSIYTIARNTVIFLGESTPESIEVLETLPSPRYASAANESGLLANFLRSNPISVNSDPYDYEPTYQENELEDTKARSIRAGVQFIISRPWFTRVWVLQELVLSVDPWVQLGAYRMRWNVFADRILDCEELTNDGGLKNLAEMDAARMRYTNVLLQRKSRTQDEDTQSSADLLQVLNSRRGAGVTDPRDMVYAHLGITKLYCFEVHYQKPISEIYTEVALYLINSCIGLGILSFAGTEAIEERRDGLPSWVPDWTSKAAAEADMHLQEEDFFMKYDMRQGIGLLFTHVTASRCPTTLGCIGAFVSRIEFFNPTGNDIKNGLPPTAMFENGSYAYIPISAQVGDLVCNFNHTPELYILRAAKIDEKERTLVDRTLKVFFMNNKKFATQKVQVVKEERCEYVIEPASELGAKVEKFYNELDTSVVGHFQLVGECYTSIDHDSRSYYGDDSRSYSDYRSMEQHIIALH